MNKVQVVDRSARVARLRSEAARLRRCKAELQQIAGALPSEECCVAFELCVDAANELDFVAAAFAATADVLEGDVHV